MLYSTELFSRIWAKMICAVFVKSWRFFIPNHEMRYSMKNYPLKAVSFALMFGLSACSSLPTSGPSHSAVLDMNQGADASELAAKVNVVELNELLVQQMYMATTKPTAFQGLRMCLELRLSSFIQRMVSARYKSCKWPRRLAIILMLSPLMVTLMMRN